MIKISTKVKTVEIVHPNDESVVLVVKRLNNLESYEYLSAISKQILVSAVKDPDARDGFLRDGKGNAVVHKESVFTIESVIIGFRKILVEWRGITNEVGEPVKFDGHDVSALFQDAMDVT